MAFSFILWGWRMKELTWERLNEVLSYNMELGFFYWEISTSNRVKIGSLAGHLNTAGYITIRIDKKLYLAHRLAFKILGYTGIDHLQVDHVNGDRADNSFNNLRLASNGENSQNSKLSKNNTSGVKGVSFLKKENKFLAQLCVNNRQVYIGKYVSIDLAKIAIEAARTAYHAGFANHG